MSEPHLSPRRKRFADYLLAHNCTALVAYRATREDNAPPKPGDKGNAAAMHKQCAAYIEHHQKAVNAMITAKYRNRISAAADAAANRITDTLNEVVDRLCNSVVNKANMIAYWEQALLIGANEVMADIRSEKPKLSHLVEKYKRTSRVVRGKDDDEGAEILTEEITTPGKKDASAILTVLKAIKPDGPSGEESYYQQIVDDIKSKSADSRLS